VVIGTQSGDSPVFVKLTDFSETIAGISHRGINIH